VVLQDHNTFIVADGMGGYVGGEVASQLAVDTIQAAFDDNNFEGNTGDLHRDGAQLAASIQMANRAIWDAAQADTTLVGMGTTLVGTRFSPRKERLYIGHVGDSRCYRCRDGKIAQITVDHNLEQMGVKGRNAHMLTRALGIGPAVEVDLIMCQPNVGDRYLLCSDGLNKMLDDDQIGAVLQVAATPEVAVETLIGQANQAGGRDNITVILIQVQAP
jgi:protein phosphatase